MNRIHEIVLKNCRLILVSLVITACAGVTNFAYGQDKAKAPTSKPRIKTHADLIQKAREKPLVKEDLVREDGSDLTKSELDDVKRTQKLFDEAVAARKKGDFEAAAGPVRECKKIRSAILGHSHYLTVSAIGLEKTVSRILNSPSDQRVELVEADKLQNKAEEALDAGDYANAVTLAKKALSMQERILGRNNHEIGNTLRIMGHAQTELVALADASESLTRAEEIIEKSYGKSHPLLARVLDRTGWLHVSQGDAQAGVEALKSAVRIYLGSVGENLDAAEATDNLGTAQAVSGDTTSGLQSKLRALVIREQLAGPEGKDTAVSYSNLAWLYGQIDMAEEVLPLRKKALEIFENKLGPDHPYTNTEAINLGLACQDRGMLDEAIRLYGQTVKRDDARPANELSPQAAGRATRLAVVCLEVGRFEEGIASLKKAINRCRAVHESGNDVAAADELHHVGAAYEHFRMYDDALKIYEEAVGWDSKDPALKSVKVLRQEQLGSVYLSLGRAADAKKILRKAVAEAETLFGKGDRKTAGPLLVLAQACEKTGDFEEGEKLSEQVLKISEEKVGPGTKANAFALRVIGRIYLRQKKMDLAKFAFEDAFRIIEKNQDIDPTEMIRIQQDRADMLLETGDPAEAAKAVRDSLDRARKLHEKKKSAQAKSLLVKSIKKTLDLGESASGVPAGERDRLRAELKSILEGMATVRAMNAEEKEWLQQLGGGASASKN